MGSSSGARFGVLVAYACVSVIFTWPLVTHLGTHLTGPVTGDTAVYVWNQWVFQHELLDHRSLPYFTDTIFGSQRTANLSLHNYTTFQNLLALPLIRILGVVTTFNVVYLIMVIVTAYATFLLAYRVTQRVPESWLAGFLFAWSPFIVTRGMGHFSVAAAAPLPMFLLLLDRAAERQRVRDAVAMGITVWWAASCDVYYAVYCLLIALVFVVARVVTIHRSAEPAHRAGAASRAVRWALDVLIVSVAGLVIAILVSGGFRFEFLGRPTRMHSLYTPMLVLTALTVLRAAWHYRTSVVPVTRVEMLRFVRLAAVTAVMAIVLLSPALYAVSVRIADGQFDTPHIFWRSSPPGMDVLAFLAPNPNHPLVPDSVTAWVTGLPNGYLENVASIPIVVLATLLTAWWAGWRASRWWLTLTIAFALLALGPFVRVAGFNTSIPGPWALVRYVPIVGLARTPARFAAVMTLGLAILFASALAWYGRTRPHDRCRMLLMVAVLLAFELLPAPLILHSAAVPAIYTRVADAPAHVTLIELPFGVRDGTSSLGNFSGRTQFFQTAHGKTILGGYLSRVPAQRFADMRSDAVIGALMTLSEHRTISPERREALTQGAAGFIRSNKIGFVVIDRARASDELRDIAIRAFGLECVQIDGDFELYVPHPHAADPHQ
jgi:hypothetical protein